MSIPVLCFSKDRPLQLDAFLRSLSESSSEKLPIAVLYTHGLEYADAYKTVRMNHSEVDFLPELNFSRQVVEWLSKIDASYCMFCCDDVLFKLPWSPSEIIECFDLNEELLAFSLRLGAEISFCQPMNCKIPSPEFQLMAPHLVWNWRRAGQLDWALPFELDCTIKRTGYVKRILEMMTKRGFDWGQPNRMEIIGTELSRKYFRDFNLMASFPQAHANCITVNRVQSVVDFPIYRRGDYSAAALLNYFTQGVRLDIEKYRGRLYNRVHIGEVFLTNPNLNTAEDALNYGKL